MTYHSEHGRQIEGIRVVRAVAWNRTVRDVAVGDISVLCPFCGRMHVHGTEKGEKTVRVPHCGPVVSRYVRPAKEQYDVTVLAGNVPEAVDKICFQAARAWEDFLNRDDERKSPVNLIVPIAIANKARAATELLIEFGMSGHLSIDV